MATMVISLPRVMRIAIIKYIIDMITDITVIGISIMTIKC